MDRRPLPLRQRGILRRGRAGHGLRPRHVSLQLRHPRWPGELRNPRSRQRRDGRHEDVGPEDSRDRGSHTHYRIADDRCTRCAPPDEEHDQPDQREEHGHQGNRPRHPGGDGHLPRAREGDDAQSEEGSEGDQRRAAAAAHDAREGCPRSNDERRDDDDEDTGDGVGRRTRSESGRDRATAHPEGRRERHRRGCGRSCHRDEDRHDDGSSRCPRRHRLIVSGVASPGGPIGAASRVTPWPMT